MSRRGWVVLVGAGIPAILTLIFIAISVSTGRHFEAITGDLFHWPGHDPLDTFGATLSVVGWGVAAAICLFTFAISRRRVFGWLGGLTMFLLIDDAFAIHDYWVPKYLIAGDHGEQVVLLAQVLLLAWILKRFWHQLTDRMLLMATGTAFALSLIADHTHSRESWVLWLDDGFKMIGIGLWAAWCVTMAFRVLGPWTVPQPTLVEGVKV